MKKILIFLAVAFLLFGCLGQTDNASVEKLAQLKQTYGLVESYSPNSQIMSAYISELSTLQAKTNSTLIRFELYTAQSFFYIFKSNEFYGQVDYQNEGCKSSNTLNAYKFASLAKSASEKALSESSFLSEQDKQSTRLMQAESVREYNQMAQEIIDSFENKCGKIF